MQALALSPQTEVVQSASLGFEPQSLKEVWRLAEIVIASGLAPKSVRSPEAAVVMIMTGRELGLTAMQSLRSIHVVEGKPLLSADLMLALVLRLPTCEAFSCVETSDTVATFVAKRRGQKETRLSFTAEQAKNAGLIGKDNWKKYAAAMLRARAISHLTRLVFPDAFVGVYEENEISPQREAERVESDVRHVPDARPTPAPKSGPREVDVSADESIAIDLASQMRKAMTPDALKGVGAAVTKAGLPDVLREALKGEYAKAKARLTPPDDASDAWEPARG